MLFVGDDLAVMLRDNFDHIPWPDCWDFPGGERDPGETPEQTVLRETEEEFGLVLAPSDLVWKRSYSSSTGQPEWFFAAHIAARYADEITLGDEGQGWALMSPADYRAHPKTIPHFADRLGQYLAERSALASTQDDET